MTPNVLTGVKVGCLCFVKGRWADGKRGCSPLPLGLPVVAYVSSEIPKGDEALNRGFNSPNGSLVCTIKPLFISVCFPVDSLFVLVVCYVLTTSDSFRDFVLMSERCHL